MHSLLIRKEETMIGFLGFLWLLAVIPLCIFVFFNPVKLLTWVLIGVWAVGMWAIVKAAKRISESSGVEKMLEILKIKRFFANVFSAVFGLVCAAAVCFIVYKVLTLCFDPRMGGFIGILTVVGHVLVALWVFIRAFKWERNVLLDPNFRRKDVIRVESGGIHTLGWVSLIGLVCFLALTGSGPLSAGIMFLILSVMGFIFTLVNAYTFSENSDICNNHDGDMAGIVEVERANKGSLALAVLIVAVYLMIALANTI